MKYRRFGQTELQMPLLTCGTMRFQHKWQDVDPAEVPAKGQANLEAVMRRALEQGINHFETARGYGSSEMQMGWVLRQLNRQDYILQTKTPPTKDPDDFLRRFDQSMDYLGVDQVDLLAIHGVNDQGGIDDTLKKGGALEKALWLKEQGRVAHIGFSSHAPMPQLMPLIETNAFSFVNLHWYYIYPSNWPAVAAAAERDMGVLIISPNDKGGQLFKPSDKMRQLCAPLSPMAFNDLYCWARPEVGTLSIGAARPSDFDEHLAALERLEETNSLLPPILARLEAALLETHGPDWAVDWWEGIKPYYQQPGEVNVLEILRIWLYAKAFGLDGFGKSRYNMLGKGGHWFPGKKAEPKALGPVLAQLKGHKLAPAIAQALAEAHELYDDHAVAAQSGPRNSN
ncbi:MAG: aldo/keto reductase [bacterium]|nr:aldo/keto reductase [bacterium]